MWWLGAVRQQAITWVNVEPDLCRHMVSLGHNELKHLLKRHEINQSSKDLRIRISEFHSLQWTEGWPSFARYTHIPAFVKILFDGLVCHHIYIEFISAAISCRNSCYPVYCVKPSPVYRVIYHQSWLEKSVLRCVDMRPHATTFDHMLV